MVAQMVGVGEETGALDTMLSQAPEDARTRFALETGVPVDQRNHVIDAAADDLWALESPVDAACGEHIAESRVFPAGHEDRQIFL